MKNNGSIRWNNISMQLFLLLLLPLSGTYGSELEWLEDGYTSSSYGVSADGSVVVGYAVDQPVLAEAFRWTEESGFSLLGTLDREGHNSSFGTAVSADGAVIVGYSWAYDTPLPSATEAFRWTQEEGMVGLGRSLGGEEECRSYAYGVSGDGSVVVGVCGNLAISFEAFRWTEEEGMVGLGFLDFDEADRSSAKAISDDGMVIVGFSEGPNGDEAFRWTKEEGMVGLGDLDGGDFYSFANDTSADGSVIVGHSTSSNGDEAFRWTQDGGMVGLGDLEGGDFDSNAIAVTADGSVIVGQATDQDGAVAFRWTEEGGMVSVVEWLSKNGVNTEGVSLYSAEGLSDDGLTVVGGGNGVSGDGAYLARVTESYDGNGLLFVSDYFSSFAHINHASTISQRSSRRTLLDQPSFFSLSTKREKQNSWALYPAISYTSWGDESTRRGGFGFRYRRSTWYLNAEASKSRSDGEYGEGNQDLDGDHIALSGGFSVGGVLDTPKLNNLMFSAGLLGSWYDTEISRAYLNGASLAESNGDTDITTTGWFTQLGWHRSLSERITSAFFISALHLTSDMDDYTETSGPFPGEVSTSEKRSLESRLGMNLGWDFHDTVHLSGSVAMVHLDEKSGDRVDLRPTGLGVMSVDVDGYDTTWQEGSLQATWQATDKVEVSLQAYGATGSDYPANFGTALTLGISL